MRALVLMWKTGCRFIIALSAPRWVWLKHNWDWCSPSHSFMLLGSVVIIIVCKSITTGWSSTGLRSACAGVVLFAVDEMVLWLWLLSGICRGITALGPCELGLAADLVIIDPILGPTGQVCPSGVPRKPLRWGLLRLGQEILVLCRQVQCSRLRNQTRKQCNAHPRCQRSAHETKPGF